MKHTHPEIIDPELRKILANELMVLRRSMKRAQVDFGCEWVCGIRLGFETMLRRVNRFEAMRYQAQTAQG